MVYLILILLYNPQILEKIEMKERFFPLVLDWYKTCVVPNHKRLVFSSSTTNSQKPEINPDLDSQQEMKALIVNLVKEASQKPEEVFRFEVLMSTFL